MDSILTVPSQREDEPFLFEVYASTRRDEVAAWGWDLSQQEEAAATQRPLGLQVMKGNPARRLYERLGFRQAGESDTHYAMEWRPPALR